MMKSEGRDGYTVLKFNDMGDFEGTYRVDNRAISSSSPHPGGRFFAGDWSSTARPAHAD
jgi:hypothetical protein